MYAVYLVLTDETLNIEKWLWQLTFGKGTKYLLGDYFWKWTIWKIWLGNVGNFIWEVMLPPRPLKKYFSFAIKLWIQCMKQLIIWRIYLFKKTFNRHDLNFDPTLSEVVFFWLHEHACSDVCSIILISSWFCSLAIYY